MSSALVPVTKESWEVIKSVAPFVQASRMFGTTLEQAAVVMLKGYELGLGLASSFEYIHVIDSKPSLAPKGAMALIQRSGELAGLKIDDQVDSKGNPTACTVSMKRTNGFEYTTTFTMADAKKADLTEGSPTKNGVRGKGNWERYPANMLRWRAVGYCADIVFPDVTGGMYRPEELGANVDEDGAPIEGTWKVASDTVIPDLDVAERELVDAITDVAEDEGVPSITLDALIAKYGAAAILAANNGKIPQTEDELAVAAAALEDLAPETEADPTEETE